MTPKKQHLTDKFMDDDDDDDETKLRYDKQVSP